jgi:transcriptional regulator with XRE-family HTH domain
MQRWHTRDAKVQNSPQSCEQLCDSGGPNSWPVTVSGAPSFGELLKKYRAAAGVTQERLAEIARVSANAVSSLERDARRAPHRETVALLADALGLSEAGRRTLEDAAESMRVRVPAQREGERAYLPVDATEESSYRILTSQLERRLDVRKLRERVSEGARLRTSEAAALASAERTFLPNSAKPRIREPGF